MNPLSQWLIPTIGPTRVKEAELETHRAMLAAGIRILREGPAAAAASADPYGEGPFRYEPTADGFRLVSELTLEGRPVTLEFGTGPGRNDPCVVAPANPSPRHRYPDAAMRDGCTSQPVARTACGRRVSAVDGAARSRFSVLVSVRCVGKGALVQRNSRSGTQPHPKPEPLPAPDPDVRQTPLTTAL